MDYHIPAYGNQSDIVYLQRQREEDLFHEVTPRNTKGQHGEQEDFNHGKQVTRHHVAVTK